MKVTIIALTIALIVLSILYVGARAHNAQLFEDNVKLLEMYNTAHASSELGRVIIENSQKYGCNPYKYQSPRSKVE